MKRVLGLLIPVFAFSAIGFAQYGITTNGLPVATVNQAYSATVQTNSFVSASSCNIVSGALPAGMTIQANGAGCLISGIPSVATTANFAITVSNTQGQTTPAQSLVLSVFGITSSSLPAGSLNSSYSFQFQASGSGAFQWSLLAGSLPAGLTLNSSGLVSGVIQSSGSFSFTVRVSDLGLGLTDSRNFTINVGGSGGQFQITTSALPDAILNQSYTATIQTTGALGNLNFQSGCLLLQGGLPPGISMGPVGTSCVLSGVPSNQGTYQFQVRASDSQGQVTPPVGFTINVASSGQGSGGVTITTPLIPSGTTAVPYLPNGNVFVFTATGGTGIYSWSVDSGNLPSGLSLGSNGALTGTPTQAGSFNFTVKVVSSGLLTSFQQTGTKNFSMTISSGGLTIVETSLPAANIGQTYSFPLHASGGNAPYRWRFGGTSLQGFSIDFNTGLITGSTQAAGTYSLPVIVTDAANAQVTFVFSLVVTSPFSILNTSLADGLPGVGYNQTFQASGGQAPYTWTITSGSLPPGLTFTQSGTISGVPSANGQFTITVLATDATGQSVSKVFTILIGPAGLVQILTASLPDGAAGSPYSQVVTASGGQLPYSWSLSTGTLPPGLTLSSSSGAIQGTPVQGGTFSFAIQATDAIGNIASKPFTIVIASSGFSVAPNQLSFFYQVGSAQPGPQQVTVSRNASVGFTAISNTSWLSVNPSGGTTPAQLNISVNPAGLANGIYNGSITVSPSGVSDPPQVVSVTLTVSNSSSTGLTVSPPALTFSYQNNAPVPSPQFLSIGGSAISFSVSASGANWLTLSPSAGVTPATVSVSVNPLGLISGTYSGTITVFGAGLFRQVPVTLTVFTPPPPSVTLNKTSLLFAYQPGGQVPPTQFVSLTSSSPISFSAASDSPWLHVTPDVGTTPSNLLISANPAGLVTGAYNGAVVITTTTSAGNGTLTVQVTLTVSSPGAPEIISVVNAASFASGPVSPGELVAISGTALGPANPAFLMLDSTGKVATLVSGVQVLFNGFSAPLVYVSATQINAVVPYEIAAQPNILVAVRYQGLTSAPYPLALAPSSAGLFTQNSSGSGPGAISNPDNSTNSPLRPAKRGDFVALYATGEGQTAPAGVTGKVTTVASAQPLTPQPLLQPTVTIGGQPALVTFYGEAPGVVSGIMQINVQIPLNAPSGDLPIEVVIGVSHSQSGVTVSVQ